MATNLSIGKQTLIIDAFSEPIEVGERRCADEIVFPAEKIARKVRVGCTKGVIEPEKGYILLPDGSLFVDHFERDAAQFRGLPSCKSFTGSVSKKAVVSLRDPYEVGFYHFLIEGLAKVAIAKKSCISEEVIFLVGKGLWESSYFDDFKSMLGGFSNQFMLHDVPVYSEKIYWIEHPHISRMGVDYLNEIFPHGKYTNNKRIFIRRSGESRRYLSNFDVLLNVAKSHGFEEVYPENYSLAEQAKLFSQARYIIAEHGAGLTNIVFRNGHDLSVLELFPPHWLNPSYTRLSAACDFRYIPIVGGFSKKGKDRRVFHVDVDVFSETLNELMRDVSQEEGN